MKYNVITVSGSPGSGKTTYARYISEKLGFRFVSAGTIFRQLAQEMGVSVVELNRIAASNTDIDRMIEKRIVEEAEKGNAVIEGHLVSWTLYGLSDLRIFLTAPLGVRILRIAKREKKPIETVVRETLEREYYEAIRYKRLYGVDVTNLNIFHLVFDTSKAREDKMKEIVFNTVRSYLGE